VHLRHAATHDVLAAWFRVDRSTITRAVNEMIADVVAYLDHTRLTGLTDATEIRVRRPTVKRAGRHQFISGKSRQNAMKALVISDARGRVLFSGASCRGSTADITQPAKPAWPTGWNTHSVSRCSPTPATRDLTRRPSGTSSHPLKHQKKRLEQIPGIVELLDAQRNRTLVGESGRRPEISR
jgi:hypothetical protein